MAKKVARGEGLPVTEFCPPSSGDDPDFIATTPELVKLRYELIVRKSAAWGENPWLRKEQLQTDPYA